MRAVTFLPRWDEDGEDEGEAAVAADDDDDDDGGDDDGGGVQHGGGKPAVSISYLLSGADDQRLKIWRLLLDGGGGGGGGGGGPGDLLKAECVQTVHAHTAAINCIATPRRDRRRSQSRAASGGGRTATSTTTRGRGRGRGRRSRWIFATGAADASIKVWSLDEGDGGGGGGNEEPPAGQARLLQTIRPSPRFFPLALALSELGDADGDDDDDGGGGGGGSLVMAAAGTRDTVQIYVADLGGGCGEFRLQATLSGHEGWVRSLDFAREEDDGGGGGGGGGGDLILASASQDKYIRLWRFHAGKELPPVAAAAAVVAADGSDPSSSALIMGSRAGAGAGGGRSPSNKAHRLKVGGGGGGGKKDYSITFEALLLGHDDWIYSARWRRPVDDTRGNNSGSKGKSSSDSSNSSNGTSTTTSTRTTTATDGETQQQRPQPRLRPRLQLLSASADNTLAVWEADPSSGVWVTAARLGEISREKGATTATGSAGGFWTGLWGPPGGGGGGGGGGESANDGYSSTATVACLGRTGSWRVWGHDRARDQWLPRAGVTGHTRAVTGIAWSRGGSGGGGDYLLSTSADQTTRLHAPWVRGIEEEEEEGEMKEKTTTTTTTWHEMARPQIHGYDLNCVDSLGASQFVSGADEKLMRVFDEPGAVARLLRRVGDGGDGDGDGDGDDESTPRRPDAADMPVLGLSNKAVVEGGAGDDGITGEYDGIDSQQQQQQRGGETTTTTTTPRIAKAKVKAKTTPLDLLPAGPPGEDALARHTLWPEVEKLYGHGYEVSCLAGSHDGRLVASACRASSANHAVVRLFETAPRWAEVRPPLAAHALTATRLRFSPPADRFLLSVGRDRVWAVFEREGGDGDGDGDGDSICQPGPRRGVSQPAQPAAHRPRGWRR